MGQLTEEVESTGDEDEAVEMWIRVEGTGAELDKRREGTAELEIERKSRVGGEF